MRQTTANLASLAPSTVPLALLPGSVLLPLGLHLSNKAAADLGVYAVTANINIMSIVWDSPHLLWSG